MTPQARAAAAVAALACLAWGARGAGGQPREVHGESSVFVGPDVTIVWGVLRGASEEATEVVVRIAVAAAAYAYVRVEGVDPFTGARRPVQAGPVGDTLDVQSARATFADFPRREIRLYATAEAAPADRPALTVYYLGVPDTTPEFASEAALRAYLADAVTKARRPAGGKTP